MNNQYQLRNDSIDKGNNFLLNVIIAYRMLLLFAVNSDWLPSPEKTAPPSHYFCMSKLNAWANTADQVQEACRETKQLIGRYFEQKHRDLVAQLVGG